MAIVTRDEIKTFLQISDASKDTLIDNFLPIVESSYLRCRGIPFHQFEGDITNGLAIIDNITTNEYTQDRRKKYYRKRWRLTGFEDIKLNLYVEAIVNDVSKMRGKVINIDEENMQITLDANASETIENVDITIYPENSQFVCAKIFQYFENLDNMDGLQSESVGNYSRQQEILSRGLPKSIATMVNQYTVGY